MAFRLRCLKGEDLDFGPKVDRCIPPQLRYHLPPPDIRKIQEGFSVGLPSLLLAPILFSSTTGAPQYLTLVSGPATVDMTALISGLGDCGSDSLTMRSRSPVYERPSGMIWHDHIFAPLLGQSIL